MQYPNGIETFYVDEAMRRDKASEWHDVGWYWWACFPGCLPDSEAFGPFETEEKAHENAKEGDFE